jgi:hypothetical protein
VTDRPVLISQARDVMDFILDNVDLNKLPMLRGLGREEQRGTFLRLLRSRVLVYDGAEVIGDRVIMRFKHRGWDEPEPRRPSRIRGRDRRD